MKVVKAIFDPNTYTLTYVVFDKETKDGVIIDPVLDYEQASSTFYHDSVNRVLNFIQEENIHIHYILETHAHADHLTGSVALKKKIPSAKIAINKRIIEVQEVFKDIYHFKDFSTSGVQFDELLDEGVFHAGSLNINVIFTPGHTPACSSFLIDDMVFTGDALFMPDYGTGRCDFPKGSAKDLYHSIHEKLYLLPDETRVFTGHDYQPNGRELKFESTIGENRKHNKQLKMATREKEFIEFRNKRDAGLNAPRLLLPSIQVNINAGHLPKAEDNGVKYLKIPIKKKD